MAERVVPDASVLLKWVLDDEDYVEQANRLLTQWTEGEVDLRITTYALAEVASGLWVAMRRGRISSADIEQAMRLFEDLDLKAEDLSYVSVVTAAIQTAVSPYDVGYACLARDLGACLLTADKRLPDQLASLGVKIEHIGAYSP